MRLEVSFDQEGAPFVDVPSDLSNRFRQFCADKDLKAQIEQDVFRADDTPHDFVKFDSDVNADDLQVVVSDWNAAERAAKIKGN